MTHNEALDRATKLLRLGLFNDSAAEATSALRKCRKLIAEHDISQEDLFPTAARGPTISVVEAAHKAEGVVASVRAAAADPEIQKTVRAGADLLSGIANLAGKIRRR